MNEVQKRAQRRIAAIHTAQSKLRAKIEAGHPRSEDLKARLGQYEVSLKALDLELALGKPMRIKGGPSVAGVEAQPATGGVNLEGK